MIRRSSGLLFVAACLAALALRVVLPAGWMPATAGQGALFTICSVDGSDAGGPVSGETGSCDFALALGPALVAAALLLPLLALPLLPAPASRPAAQRARRHAARPFGQGPPRA
jgi:hypothetical protein